MMRKSGKEAAETRRSAVEEASKLYRERGLDAVSVADVMGGIGMTVGGFYRHFESKETLMVEACAGAFESKDRIRETGAASGQDNIADLFNRYLSPGHRDSAATGCPIPPLLSTISHRSPELRRIFTEGVLRQLEQIALRAPGGGAEAHVAAAASMFGALALSRAVDDEALSDLILRHTREYWIDALEAEPAAVAAGGHEAS